LVHIRQNFFGNFYTWGRVKTNSIYQSLMCYNPGTCVKKPAETLRIYIVNVRACGNLEDQSQTALIVLYRKDITMDNKDRLADLEQEVKERRSIKTTSWNTFHIPDEALPKNIDNKYRCSICDKKIPRDNNFCYACRKEYSISREGIFKYNIPKYEKERQQSIADVYNEDKSFPNKCILCRKRRVKRNDGMCVRCLKFMGIIEEEE
jgi:hypothetical protein